MNHEGPALELLLRRLSECPAEFIETCAVRDGHLQLIAIVCDYFRPYVLKDQDPFWEALRSHQIMSYKPENHFALLSIATWLLGHEWFVDHRETLEPAWLWLTSDSLATLANSIKASDCLNDPDRREELVRLCLASIDLRPAGETKEQAMDRLTTLDSVERRRVLNATLAAERRAREVREAMVREKARESASRYGE
jgi:hypothetical protein